jgi:signal transduction histidine kinase
VRSIANRLALLFGAITLGAIAVVYFYVVPQLESSLRATKLRNLATAAQRYSGPISRAIHDQVPAPQLYAAVRRVDEAANARVTLLRVNRDRGLQLTPVRDHPDDAQSVPGLSIALRAATRGKLQTGSESARGGRMGAAALPLYVQPQGAARPVLGFVAVFSATLSDVEGDVALIRRRIIVAGGIALVIALLAGFLVARALSQRIERMERAARRVAAGDFSARFVSDRADELGRLAEALNAMQRQLAELDSARKRFIATASHELRTPLFSLSGFLELLQDEDLDEETRERFLGQLREQVDRLVTLATGLLDLSKLEAGALVLAPERTDLGGLAERVSEEFAPALAGHRSRLEVRLPAGAVRAVCDPDRVAQVMRILIDNALTHTPPGTDLVVTAGRHNGRVRLGVTDFGPGIHGTMLPRIFEPFITTDDAQGSGLGLAIARELAERMAGSLRVDSQPGRTVFTLELPG